MKTIEGGSDERRKEGKGKIRNAEIDTKRSERWRRGTARKERGRWRVKEEDKRQVHGRREGEGGGGRRKVCITHSPQVHFSFSS